MQQITSAMLSLQPSPVKTRRPRLDGKRECKKERWSRLPARILAALSTPSRSFEPADALANVFIVLSFEFGGETVTRARVKQAREYNIMQSRQRIELIATVIETVKFMFFVNCCPFFPLAS